MITHTFADWGNIRQNMVESLGITAASISKDHGENRDKSKCEGDSLVVMTNLGMK